MNSSALGVDDINHLPPSKRDLSHKKRKGVFYTPDLATQLLAEWGIRRADDKILEPSFGGCGFLAAAFSQLQKLGVLHPESQLFGCDVDPIAFTFLNELTDGHYDVSHFKQRDFLTVLPNDFQIEGVDVVIGNPPYVSWHNMLPSQRDSALAIINPDGLSLNRKASLWTFFVAHCLHFLNTGGRMAWILPGSFMHADYAEPLRKVISSQFYRTLAVLLEQRIFIEEGTEESSIVLLCEGYRQGPSQAIRFSSVQGLSELEQIVKVWSQNGSVGSEWTQQVSRLLAPESSVLSYDKLLSSPALMTLGHLIKIRIGLVTGDNKFFVLNKSSLQRLQLPRIAFRPIVARQAHFRGLRVTEDDLIQLEAENVRCLLLNTDQLSQEENSTALTNYLNNYPSETIRSNRTFAKRKPWYRIAQEIIPDAFFSCMNWHGPSLILNAARTTCTNTIYRVQFIKDGFNSHMSQQRIAISLQSTFSQFSAELAGRICGSGALKLEPSDVAGIALLLPLDSADVSTVFYKIDALIKEGKTEEARHVSDQFLVQQELLTASDSNLLEEGLLYLRKLRQGARQPISQ